MHAEDRLLRLLAKPDQVAVDHGGQRPFEQFILARVGSSKDGRARTSRLLGLDHQPHLIQCVSVLAVDIVELSIALFELHLLFVKQAALLTRLSVLVK